MAGKLIGEVMAIITGSRRGSSDSDSRSAAEPVPLGRLPRPPEGPLRHSPSR
jgi:hypothetical protein